MSDVAIRVEHLSKRYRLGEREPYKSLRETLARAARKTLTRAGSEPEKGYFWALDDISFEIRQGEAVGIIGRNGAGKSTLLKILARITKPTEGRAEIYGRIGSLLEVGTGFHPELTGRENIYLNGAILGMKREEIARKFDEIVDFAEIEQFLDTPVKRYSSGMYVRLAFAVAAHLEPEILLVDEVLAVGDAQFQKKCLGKMGEVAQEGRTVLFVSHNMAAVETLCEIVIVLSKGTVIAIGPTSEVVKSYLKKSDAPAMVKIGFFSGIFTQNLDGTSTSTFRIGETIRIRIQLALGNQKIVAPVIGIGVNSYLGQRLFTVGTYFQKTPFPQLSGNVEIVCDITDPVLSPGEYTIKFALGDNPLSNIIELDDISRFEIVASDYFGNGRLPNSLQGILVAKSIWKVQQVDEK